MKKKKKRKREREGNKKEEEKKLNPGRRREEESRCRWRGVSCSTAAARLTGLTSETASSEDATGTNPHQCG